MAIDINVNNKTVTKAMTDQLLSAHEETRDKLLGKLGITVDELISRAAVDWGDSSPESELRYRILQIVMRLNASQLEDLEHYARSIKATPSRTSR